MRSLRLDLGISIASSLAILLATVVAGQMLTSSNAPATVIAVAPTPMMSCLERPLRPQSASTVNGIARLCLTVDNVQASASLTSAVGGALYTAWLGYQERPGARQAGACSTAEGLLSAGTVLPSRLDAAVAAADGAVHLSHTLPGMQPPGNTEIEILVVEHGPASATGPSDRTRSLLSWDQTWAALPAWAHAPSDASARLLGCAAFWLRGGAELTDH